MSPIRFSDVAKLMIKWSGFGKFGMILPMVNQETAGIGKRELWIDILRGIAIVAVVIDHIYYEFQFSRNTFIWQQMYFSIPWFVFLSGVTNTLSLGKKALKPFVPLYVDFWRRRYPIIVAYILATIVTYTTLHLKNWNIHVFWKQLLFFSSQPTYYFINLIVQLYLIFPFLYIVFFSMRKRMYQIVIGVLVIVLSVIILPQRIMPWPFSPAGALFGGMYLSVFFLGMVYQQSSIRYKRMFLFGCIAVVTAYEALLILQRVNFLTYIQNVNVLIWSLSLLFIFKAAVEKVEKNNIIIRLFRFLGRHSVSIYLYHFLILTYLSKITLAMNVLDFSMVAVTTISGSLFIEYSIVLISGQLRRILAARVSSAIV